MPAGRTGFAPETAASSAAMRSRMVQRLAAQGISDPRVLHALTQVERHRFVDSALSSQAYEDTSLPIGFGQTISKPNVVGRMIELLLGAPALAHQPDARLGRVLEIGTGCGYQATLLSHVAKEHHCLQVSSLRRFRNCRGYLQCRSTLRRHHDLRRSNIRRQQHRPRVGCSQLRRDR